MSDLFKLILPTNLLLQPSQLQALLSLFPFLPLFAVFFFLIFLFVVLNFFLELFFLSKDVFLFVGQGFLCIVIHPYPPL